MIFESPEKLIALLSGKDNNAGYSAMKHLAELSQDSDEIYSFMDKCFEMLDSHNSFVRSRGISLIAANAQWDEEKKIDGALDKYLEHVVDEKPITARQCIQNLNYILEAKPELAPRIKQALETADLTKYKDSMRPLIEKDISEVIKNCTGLL